MKSTIFFVFCLTVLYVNGQNKKVFIENPVTEIEFKNPYKFNSEIEEEFIADKNPWKNQTALLAYQKKGDYKKTLELFDLESNIKASIPLSPMEIDSIKSIYTPIDAKTYIIKQSESKQVVIINEAHHNPGHRIFTRSLLKELYENGYTYLGLEALYNGPKGGTPIGNNGSHIKDERDSLLNLRGYAVFQSGNYLEPQMGNLIRLALEIGFTVFSYEKTGVGSGDPRELGQARNIQKILEKEPNAKILIHCGYSHAYEGVDVYASGGKAMAGWLSELTGIDPFTINQATYSEEFSKSELNHPLLNALSFNQPKVLVDDEGNPMKFVSGNAYTDIAVINPITEYTNNRPSWLFSDNSGDVIIEISKLNHDYPAMILAYNHGEDISKAIPVDMVEINDKSIIPHLALPNGRFTIVIATRNGKTKKLEISVK